MSKRLQVLLRPQEYKQFAQAAKLAGMSLGEWVRQKLRGTHPEPILSPAEKMARIREFMRRGNAPTGSVDQMLKDIEKGRR